MFLPPENEPPTNIRQTMGSFSKIPDFLLLHIFSYAYFKEKLVIANGCRLLRILIKTEEFWKELLLQRIDWVFQNSWYHTFLTCSGITDCIVKLDYYSPVLQQTIELGLLDIRLFEPFKYPFDQVILEMLSTQMNSKLLYLLELCSLPAMIRSKSDWKPRPCYLLDNLITKYQDTQFVIANSSESPKFISMSFKNYLTYAESQHDESPLYLFEKTIEKCPDLIQDFEMPFITTHYFELLGDIRPPYRWLIIGPMRSGSYWHVDPPGTSAWNTLMQGRKRWALYPPQKEPPGLKKPMSPLYWFIHVYPTLTMLERPMEVMQYPGDTMIVPAGWWHCVLNLDEMNVAITRNWTSSVTIKDCVGHLVETNAELGQEFLEKLSVFPQLSSSLNTKESNVGVMNDAIAILKDRMGLNVSESDLEITPSENTVIYYELGKVFLKFYKSLESFQSEVVAFDRIAHLNKEFFPRVLGHGIHKDIPYLITQECLINNEPSVAFHQVYNEKLIDGHTTVVQLAPVFKSLHALAPHEYKGKSFTDTLVGWKHKYIENHTKWGYLNYSLLIQTKTLIDRFFSTPVSLKNGVLHGDATSGNIFGQFIMTDTFCFVPTHIIDFGDAFHSDFDPLWDIACLFFTVMRCDGRLLRIFLDEYGMEWSVDVIVARMMGYLVLSPTKALVREVTSTMLQSGLLNPSWKSIEQYLFASLYQ